MLKKQFKKLKQKRWFREKRQNQKKCWQKPKGTRLWPCMLRRIKAATPKRIFGGKCA